jgi:NAD(P)-dependent dehydrogenase (short-subunit alcohol dehydrogenase family)
MGRAAAIAFAREGADVAISYHPDDEPDAREVIDLIRKEGRVAVALPGDIRDEALCNRIVADAVRELGGLDILINNAARQQQRQSLLDITSEDFDATFKTNVYSMFWLTKAALPHLTPGSAIIQTTSEQAYDPSENLVDYAMTKAAMMDFTKSMAKQLGPKAFASTESRPGRSGRPSRLAAARRRRSSSNSAATRLSAARVSPSSWPRSTSSSPQRMRATRPDRSMAPPEAAASHRRRCTRSCARG